MKTTSRFVRPSRRQFLSTLLAAGAAPVFVPGEALGLGKRPAASERITLACFGGGTIAYGTINNFLQDDRVQVIAIADPADDLPFYGYRGELRGGRGPWKKSIEAHYAKATPGGSYKGCTAVEDFRELLARADIDAVNNSSPDHWHGVMTVLSARAGKHIYGQKPLSLTVGEGRAMCEAVKKAGVTWQTGSQQRSDIYFRMAAEFIRNQRLGKLEVVRVGLPGGHTNWNQHADKQTPTPVPAGLNYDLWQGPAPMREYRPALLPLNWRHNYDYSGGMVTDIGAHHIDIAQWALGMDESGPVKFENLTATLPPATDLYNTATAFHFACVYANGVRMEVSDQFEGGLTFLGEGGKSIAITRGKLVTNPPELRAQKLKDGEIKLYESKQHERNFIDCIYSGQPTVAPIEAAHRTISIAHLANLGLRNGISSFAWNPETEKSDHDAINAGLSRPLRAPWSLDA